MNKQTKDDIINPPHYANQLFETIHILDDLNLPRNLDRAVEYCMRANRKNGEQDILKALWYLIRHLILYYRTSSECINDVLDESVQKSHEYFNLKEDKN